KIFFKVFAVSEEIEEAESALFDPLFTLTILMLEREQARPTSFDLNEVRRGHYRTREDNIENIFAIVASCHHSHGDANACAARVVIAKFVFPPLRLAVQIIVREIERHLLRAPRRAGGHLERERRASCILVWPATSSFFVQQLRQFC